MSEFKSGDEALKHIIDETPKYTEKQLQEALDKQAERLGKIKNIYWITNNGKRKWKLVLQRLDSTEDGLVVYVQ